MTEKNVCCEFKMYADCQRVAELQAEKANILKMIKDLAQSDTCRYYELDIILNKFKGE